MIITNSACEQQLKLVPRDTSDMKEMAAVETVLTRRIDTSTGISACIAAPKRK